MITGAITYRAVAPSDFDALHDLVSRWDVCRNLGTWPWPPDEAFTRKRCVPRDDDDPNGDGFIWAICADDHLIGTVGVVTGALGYMIHPDHQGRGLARRAIDTALTRAFGALCADVIHADIWADNAVSRHILIKAGFRLAATQVVHALARDTPTERETYHLARTDWSALMARAE